MRAHAPLMHTTLAHAALMTPSGPSRGSLSIMGSQIAGTAMPGAFTVDLRDHMVFPGLLNAHDHLHVNAVPPLPAGGPFPNSYAWIEAFQEHFHTPAVVAALQRPKALRMRHGALKNLLAGTTCVVHHDPWHAALDADDFPVTLLRDFGWSYALGGPAYGPPVRESFRATPAGRPWIIHLAEGTDATAAAELSILDAMGCLAANSVLVHGVGMSPADMDRVIARGATVVWCPGSNRALLGRSMNPTRLYEAGHLLLGSDSRLSGERDLLEEMRGVLSRGELDADGLLRLVTGDASRLLKLDGHGSLAAGSTADLVIVQDRGRGAGNLAGISRHEIRAVVRQGLPRIADPDFAAWFDASGVEAVAVTLDGHAKLMDKNLAMPGLMAMEPGLAYSSPALRHHRETGVSMGAH
jgi:cytosine/adenosine deaminase-related metal-dependent hydrolase